MYRNVGYGIPVASVYDRKQHHKSDRMVPIIPYQINVYAFYMNFRMQCRHVLYLAPQVDQEIPVIDRWLKKVIRFLQWVYSNNKLKNFI